MSQPIWKTVYTTDSHRLLVDTTGVYAPELEVADEVFDAPAKERFILFRISCEPMQLVADDEDPLKFYLVGKNYKPDWGPPSKYEEWFAKDLSSVARSTGSSVDELVKMLTSSDPKDLANAYEDLGGYHGYENFDSDPIRLSEAKLNKRWK